MTIATVGTVTYKVEILIEFGQQRVCTRKWSLVLKKQFCLVNPGILVVNELFIKNNSLKYHNFQSDFAN